MRPNDLPCLGPIKAPIDRFYGVPEMDGQNILCIGMSESEIDSMLVTRGSASVTVLTMWEQHIDAKPGKYPIIIGDITKRTSFNDGHFDGIVTNSLLEHISDLSAGFREMCRVTKLGAWNFHCFGPAWSCAYGSHLYVDDKDPNLNFSLWQLPAFFHLLCSRQEIVDYYSSLGYTNDSIAYITRDLYNNDYINRVFYDQYVRLFNDFYTLEMCDLITIPVPRDLLLILRQKCLGAFDFSTYGGSYRFRIDR